jgi:hypothetical protein
MCLLLLGWQALGQLQSVLLLLLPGILLDQW